MDLQPSDMLFILFVIWLAMVIIDGSSGGGGKRARVPA